MICFRKIKIHTISIQSGRFRMTVNNSTQISITIVTLETVANEQK